MQPEPPYIPQSADVPVRKRRRADLKPTAHTNRIPPPADRNPHPIPHQTSRSDGHQKACSDSILQRLREIGFDGGRSIVKRNKTM